MKEKGFGGGHTVTGLHFERRQDLLSRLETVPGYQVKQNIVFYKGKEVARSYKKSGLYRYLKERDMDWSKQITKKLLPDEALHVLSNNTVFIIEMKFQKVAGSVDEKLQTCDFKKKQYVKLLSTLGVEVEYIYILNDWFNRPPYQDTLDYISSVGCHYYFEELPLAKLGLPYPPTLKN